jgi:cytidine deaminase
MAKLTGDEIAALTAAAADARKHAYSPYSLHKVGAAVLDTSGIIHSACNVEFVSLSQSVHAERAALVKMAGAGARQLRAVAVVGPYSGVPCAECRQALWEFACGDPDVAVVSAPTDGPLEQLRLGDIYPRPYGPEAKNLDPRNF